MRRRTFLAGALLTPTLGLAPARGHARAPARWGLGCRAASYGKFAERAWTHLPELGVSRIYLQAPAPDQVASVRAKLKAHGLTAPVLGGRAELGRDGAMADLEAQLAACEALGARYLFVSAKHEGIAREAAYGRLYEAGDRAERRGVTIVLETHPDLGTNAAVQLATMRAVDHPHVRVNFDTGNLSYYNEGADAVRELEAILDYVATVELKDHDRKPRSWHFPALGDGKVDFAGLFRVLDARRFSGPFTIEIEGVEGHPWDEAETRRAVERSVRFVRGLHAFD
jgi:sugar phosphate isomerase/epimerase